MCRLYSRYELSNEYQPANSEPPTHPHCKVLSTLLSGSIGKCISGCIQNMLNFCLYSSPAQRRNRSELLVRAISVWHLRSPQNKEWSQVIPAQGSSLPCHWWSLAQAGGPSWPSGASMGLKLLANLKMRYSYVDVAVYNVCCAELKVMIEWRSADLGNY